MRQLKFRGKSLDNGKWVYGYGVCLIPEEGLVNIFHKQGPNLMQASGVDPETVGQFTGRKIKGNECYEGDIILSESWGERSRLKNKYHVVEWINCGWKASGYNGQMKVSPDLDVRSDFEIVGNIHDNPELLK